MKVQISYRKTCEGKISAEMNVLDLNDYPSVYIFDHDEDWATDEGFKLKKGEIHYIRCTYDTAGEAEAWAERQSRAIYSYLSKWEDIPCPSFNVIEL